MNEVRIPYRPKKLVSIAGIIFFGLGAGFMGYVASSNEEGLILFSIFEFSVENATIFLWVILGALFIFVGIGVIALEKSFFSKREIVITNECITSPKSSSSKINITVNFSDIIGITIQTVQKSRTINIAHTDGTLSIPNTMLPNKKVFEDLFEQIQNRTNG